MSVQDPFGRTPEPQSPAITSSPQNDGGHCHHPHREDSAPSFDRSQAVAGDPDSPVTGRSCALDMASSGSGPPQVTHSVLQRSASPRAAAKRLRTSHAVSDSKSLKRGKSSGSLQSDSLACQTKFLVLQFLHESMNEESVLHLSQSSFSNTSESEPRCMSHAERLRQQWQNSNCSQSSSTTFHSDQSRPKSKVKLKSSKTCHIAKDGSRFQDVAKQTKPSRNRKRVSSRTTVVTESNESQTLTGTSAAHACCLDKLIRSVSETNENGDNGSYFGDADDELGASFDSSQQGSVTSCYFRERLALFHKHHHPNRPTSTPKDQTECVVCDVANDRCEAHAMDDDSASSILSLDMINIEQQPLSPSTQCARVGDYLLQMSQTSVDSLHYGDSASVDMTDLDRLYLEAAAEELNTLQDDIVSQTGSEDGKCLRFDESENSATSDESGQEDSDDQVEAACLGASPDGSDQVDGMPDPSVGADRSNLSLDVGYPQGTALLMDAVHSLQQDIEEEMSSLESEFEEALQSRLHSPDHCCHSPCYCGTQSSHILNLGTSRSSQSQSQSHQSQSQNQSLSQSRSQSQQSQSRSQSQQSQNQSQSRSQSRQTRSRSCCSLSPEAAEAVRMLARIGDEVQQQHFEELDRAVERLLGSLHLASGVFSYEAFSKAAAPVVLDGEVGQWKQVATLLLYSQRVALHLTRFGRQGLSRVVDYTARMLVDTAADFIIRQGGWAQMFDPGSTTPSSPDHPGPVLHPFLGPLTASTGSSSRPTQSPGTTTDSGSAARTFGGVDVGESPMILAQPAVSETEDLAVTAAERSQLHTGEMKGSADHFASGRGVFGGTDLNLTRVVPAGSRPEDGADEFVSSSFVFEGRHSLPLHSSVPSHAGGQGHGIHNASLWQSSEFCHAAREGLHIPSLDFAKNVGRGILPIDSAEHEGQGILPLDSAELEGRGILPLDSAELEGRAPTLEDCRSPPRGALHVSHPPPLFSQATGDDEDRKETEQGGEGKGQSLLV
ncbi:uncharacterized protein LOC143297653 [Babylonia areolata]|uniref:uncharacterized protein LOC143297653 n=1 Tax=Babylonia areolata TaxID=304850 RepID=UPI003FD58450